MHMTLYSALIQQLRDEKSQAEIRATTRQHQLEVQLAQVLILSIGICSFKPVRCASVSMFHFQAEPSHVIHIQIAVCCVSTATVSFSGQANWNRNVLLGCVSAAYR